LCSLIGVEVTLVSISYINQMPKFFIEPSKCELHRVREIFVNKENFVKLRAAIVESVAGSLSSFSKGQFFKLILQGCSAMDYLALVE